jgi:hypothetical protein
MPTVFFPARQYWLSRLVTNNGGRGEQAPRALLTAMPHWPNWAASHSTTEKQDHVNRWPCYPSNNHTSRLQKKSFHHRQFYPFVSHVLASSTDCCRKNTDMNFSGLPEILINKSVD